MLMIAKHDQDGKGLRKFLQPSIILPSSKMNEVKRDGR